MFDHNNPDLTAGNFTPDLYWKAASLVPIIVLLQSLFHLPVFRRLVLNYHLSERVLEKCKSHTVSTRLLKAHQFAYFSFIHRDMNFPALCWCKVTGV